MSNREEGLIVIRKAMEAAWYHARSPRGDYELGRYDAALAISRLALAQPAAHAEKSQAEPDVAGLIERLRHEAETHDTGPDLDDMLIEAAAALQRQAERVLSAEHDAQFTGLMVTAWKKRAEAAEKELAEVRKDALRELSRELNTLKWIGSDEGWDMAIRAVREYVDVALKKKP